MATLVLQAAGSALGAAFGPVGAAIGQAAGAVLGGAIDQSILNSFTTVSGARLSTARIPGADEGTAITRTYGTTRIGGTLFWATHFEEEVTTERSGGKALGQRVRTYKYYANFAIGLCEGEIAAVRRVWADGQELDLTEIEMRVYKGTADQAADPLIEAKQGSGNAPAYRNLAYIVFERLPLDGYGNRIPVLQFEVLRVMGTLEASIKAITVIPGASEHGYSPVKVTERTDAASAHILNRNVSYAATDWEASIDELQALCPNLRRVSLVVSWFGTDLNVGSCKIVPGVEVAHRTDESTPWLVSGIARDNAHLVSQIHGSPAYGGTPNDAAVIAAIQDLKARGLSVTLYPLLMMDIPSGNGLPDPYGGSQQAAYPWRGRITLAADKTAATRGAIESFCGTARFADFGLSGGTITYSGSEQGYRRMILHYAMLAGLAGGVDALIIGSEMRGLTQLRDQAGAFPFVEQLVSLANDVKAHLGSATKLTYAADWSEYFGYHPADGTGDVYFHLDPLWASPAIDAVGIDNYMPLADWRDGDLLAANPDGMQTADDQTAMSAMVTSGEGFDWYYASDGDRINRLRSAITDGLADKPWTFRYKDIGSWWSNLHYDRRGGAEASSATGWRAGMKPVWFTELGCPAIERGANQPNVFVDPKSAESHYPYFSSGQRSDCMQRRFLAAHFGHWAGGEPLSGMIDMDNIYVWTWDARPSPAFPYDTSLFADGGNWQTGHWLNGRLGAATLPDVIAAILDENGFSDYDVSAVSGDLTGYVQGDVTSPRQMIEPLMSAFQIDCREAEGKLFFASRAKRSNPARKFDVLADVESEPQWLETRGQESDFASQATLSYYDPAADYESAVARSRQVVSANERISSLALTGVIAEATATEAAEELLRDLRISRRAVTFHASPFEFAIEPGDAIKLDGVPGLFRVTKIDDGETRTIEAAQYAPPLGGHQFAASIQRLPGSDIAADFAPLVAFMDLPRLGSAEVASYASAAVLTRPWWIVALASSVGTEGYLARATVERPATIGKLTAALGSGVSGRFDWSQRLELDLYFGSFSSTGQLQVLSGANQLVLVSANGACEIISFLNAEETASRHWQLSGLLRGQYGTEDVGTLGAEIGATAVLLDSSVVSLGLDVSEMGLSQNWLAEGNGKRSGPYVFAGGQRAATPLSPVHLSARRLLSGDISLTWIRRGRTDANNWDAYDIPLDEPEERYKLDILSSSDTVLRSIEVTAAAYIYAAADEIADFGGLQSAISFRVRQIGWTVANGFPATGSFNL